MENRTYLLLVLAATVAFVFFEPQNLLILFTNQLAQLLQDEKSGMESQASAQMSKVQAFEDKILSGSDVEAGIQGLIEMAQQLHHALPKTPRNRRKYVGGASELGDISLGQKEEDTSTKLEIIAKEMSQQVEAAYAVGSFGAWGLFPSLPLNVSKQALFDAALVGDPRAQLALSDRYLTGRGLPANCQEAYRLARLVGSMYVDDIVEDGSQLVHLPPIDLEERDVFNYQTSMRDELYGADQLAFEENLAAAGDLKHLGNVGYKLMHGLGMQQDHEEAFALFENAAMQGDAFSMAHLGLMYSKGWHVKQDYDKARKWFEKGADLDDPIATHNLGILHFNGLGVPQSFRKALRYFRRAATEFKHADSYHAMGSMHMYGKGVDLDVERAIEFFNLALDRGHQRSLYELSILHGTGQADQGKVDCHTAVYSMMMFLDGVSEWSQETDTIVDILDSGDTWEALLLFSVLGDQGSLVALRNAAWILTQGKTQIDKNTAEKIALNMYLELAHRNESVSMINAANLLRKQPSPDYPLIIQLLQNSIKYKEVEAMVQLGLMYDTGEGLTQNFTAALNLYMQAYQSSEVFQHYFATGFLVWWLKIRIKIMENLSFLPLFIGFTRTKQQQQWQDQQNQGYGFQMDDVIFVVVTFVIAWILGVAMTSRSSIGSIFQRIALYFRQNQ